MKKFTITLIALMVLVAFAFGQNELRLNVISVSPQAQIFENDVISPLFNMSLYLKNQSGTSYLGLDIKSISSQPIIILWNKAKMIVNDRVYPVQYSNELPSILNPNNEINAEIELTKTFIASSQVVLVLPMTYNNDVLTYKMTLKIFARPSVKIFKPKNIRNVYAGIEITVNTNEMKIGGRLSLQWFSAEFKYSFQTNTYDICAFLDFSTRGKIQWYAGVGGQLSMGNLKNASILANLGGSIKLLSDKIRLYTELDYNVAKSSPYLSAGIQYGF